LKRLSEVATTKARIYVVFNVTWLGDGIFDVSAMEYSACVKCLMNTFEMSWRYSRNGSVRFRCSPSWPDG